MRSVIAPTTLLLILGMFFFQTGCSSSQQPDKQSLQQKKEDITSNPSISAEQSIEPPSPAKLVTATPNIADQQLIELNQQLNSFTNSIGIKLMPIPKGKFMMGSPETDIGRVKIETQHEVTISQNFYMGATEVTQAQWQQVMGNKPSFFKGDELPVEQISWEEEVEFCKRLSEMPDEKKAGRKYRLPTEAEWEYACRAGTKTPFHFGSQLNGMQANCFGTKPYGTETKGPYLEKTFPVGKYPANAWGLYDMHGNLWEWCSDWYRDYTPDSVTDPIGPPTGSGRVTRGGSWRDDAVNCRSARRSGGVPSSRDDDLGFRVALSSIGDATVIENPSLKDEPRIIQDPKEITNSIGIKLMLIPKGKFLMGSPESKEGRFENETHHRVTITKDFYMGAMEVTQAQWQKVMGNNPSKFKGDQLPVETVSWDEAVEFCKRLSEMPEEKKAGRKYRLPTEAEWEYACRAGTTTPFHFGSQLNGRQANCDGTKPYGTETKGPYLENTSSVGTYPANAWGLYDMHGNVWEWCSDWYEGYPPESVTDPIGPATGSDRVRRGGCWGGGAVFVRSAIRGRYTPSDRDDCIGFRVALSSSGIPK